MSRSLSLLIDVAGASAVVALVKDQQVIAQIRLTFDRRLGTSLLTAIDSLMRQEKIALEKLRKIVVSRSGVEQHMAVRTCLVIAGILAYAAHLDLEDISSAS